MVVFDGFLLIVICIPCILSCIQEMTSNSFNKIIALPVQNGIKISCTRTWCWRSPCCPSAQDVSPTNPVFQNVPAWCNWTVLNQDGFTYYQAASDHTARKLRRGVFLICGDHAWPAIPSHVVGRPCTIGRLTLLAPNLTMLVKPTQAIPDKRSLHSFAKNCDDILDFWSLGKCVLTSLFVLGVAAGKALGLLDKLGCWLAKQTNATLLALSGLLTDVDPIRYITLKNRAAIDFLLLAHGHGGEEFDGMCCMNLSDHCKLVFTSIKELQIDVSKLREESESDWFNALFGGWQLAKWVKDFLKMGCLIVIVIFVILLLAPCLLSFLQRALQRTMNAALLVEKQKGGTVGSDSRSASLSGSSTDLSIVHLYP